MARGETQVCKMKMANPPGKLNFLKIFNTLFLHIVNKFSKYGSQLDVRETLTINLQP